MGWARRIADASFLVGGLFTSPCAPGSSVTLVVGARFVEEVSLRRCSVETDPARWVWGTIMCRRCDMTSVVVVEESSKVARIGGVECGRCGGRRARFTFRGGVCATESLATKSAEDWVTAALTDDGPTRGA